MVVNVKESTLDFSFLFRRKQIIFLPSLMLDGLFSFLPDGWLPRWQLIVALTATFNTVQNFLTLSLTQRLYNNIPPAQVTSLQARTFAVWTLMSAFVRAYAAFNIHEKTAYDLALISYLIAFGHFSSEILIFRTAKPGPVMSAVATASISLVWMVAQYDNYVQSR